MSHERLIGVEIDGMETVIPSVYQGRILTPEQARDVAVDQMNKGGNFPKWPASKEGREAAQLYSTLRSQNSKEDDPNLFDENSFAMQQQNPALRPMQEDPLVTVENDSELANLMQELQESGDTYSDEEYDELVGIAEEYDKRRTVDSYLAGNVASNPYNPTVSNPIDNPFFALQGKKAKKLRLSDVPDRAIQTSTVSPSEMDEMSPEELSDLMEQEIGTPANPTQAQNLSVARRAGLDTETGMTDKMRKVGALAGISPDVQIMAWNQIVLEDLAAHGIPIPTDDDGNELTGVIRIDAVTGLPAYLRPLTERDFLTGDENEQNRGKARWTLINPAGLGREDLSEFAVDATQIGAEIAAASFAGLLTFPSKSGPVVATSMAVAAGATANAAVRSRQMALEAMGIDPEIVAHMDDEQMKQAWIAGLGEAGGYAVYGGYRLYANRFLRTLDKTPEQIAALTRSARRELRYVEELEARLKEIEGRQVDILPNDLSTPQFNIGVGAATRDPALLVAEAQAGKGITGEAGARKAAEDIANASGLVEAQRIVMRNAAPRPPVREPMGTEDIAEAAREAVQRGEGMNAARGRVERAQQKLDDLLEELSPQEVVAARGRYAPLREHGRTAAKIARKREEIAWGKMNDQKVFLDNDGSTEITQHFNQLNKTQKDALSESYAASIVALRGDVGFTPRVDEIIAGGGRAKLPLDEAEAQLRGLAQREIPMEQLHVLQSHLKQQLRDLSTVGREAKVGWDRGSLKQTIKTIQRQIDGKRFLKQAGPVGPDGARRLQPLTEKQANEFIELYGNAQEATLDRVFKYENEFWRNLTRGHTNKEGEFIYDVGDAAVRDMVWKSAATGNGETIMRSLLDVVGETPKARLALIDDLEEMFRQSTRNSKGEFQRGNAIEFLQDYGPQYTQITGKKLPGQLNGAFIFDNGLKKAQRQYKQAQKILEDSFGTKLAGDNIITGDMGAMLLGGELSPVQVGNMMRRLEKSAPKVAADLRVRTGQQIDNLVAGSENSINWRAIDDLVDNKSGVLREMYGPQYVTDMTMVRDVARVIQRGKSATGFKQPVQPVLLQITRSLIGPLSRKQRFLTALNRLGTEYAAVNLRKVITTPELLGKYIQIAQTNPSRVAWTTGLIDLFGFEAAQMIANDMGEEYAGYFTGAARFKQEVEAAKAQQAIRSRAPASANLGFGTEARP
jgi:hypothetical protein